MSRFFQFGRNTTDARCDNRGVESHDRDKIQLDISAVSERKPGSRFLALRIELRRDLTPSASGINRGYRTRQPFAQNINVG